MSDIDDASHAYAWALVADDMVMQCVSAQRAGALESDLERALTWDMLALAAADTLRLDRAGKGRAAAESLHPALLDQCASHYAALGDVTTAATLHDRARRERHRQTREPSAPSTTVTPEATGPAELT